MSGRVQKTKWACPRRIQPHPHRIEWLQRRDGSGAAGAVRLYQDLVADAFATLPAAVGRLVILPDGPLHRLPFDALRPALEAPPVAARFQISLAPSAAIWLHLREAQHDASATSRALVLADPELPGAAR